MTNSIWHKASEKPELNKYVVVRKHGFAQWKVFKFDNKTTFYEPFTGDLWAYVADVITQADKVELQADKAERLQKQLDSLKKYSDSLRNRINKMLKKNKTLKNTASDYFMKSVELGIELEKTKSNN